MRMVIIRPIEKPKFFKDVAFSEAEWVAANAGGEKTVPYVTAIEAVRNSRGLYRIVDLEEKPPTEVKVGGLSLDQMDNAALKLMAVHMGVTLRKKNIHRTDLITLVRAKLDAIEVADDEPEDDEDGSSDVQEEDSEE